MEVLRNGKFSVSYESKDLIKGIRSESNVPRNSKTFTSLTGMIGKDSGLTALPNLSRIDTSSITDGFPYPQLFVLTSMIIICGASKIYEWNGTSLGLKLTTDPGNTWKVIDFHDYVYLSNGKVAVVRDPNSQTYSVSSTLPVFSGGCNYNGQVVIGGKDIIKKDFVLTASLGSYTIDGQPIDL